MFDQSKKSQVRLKANLKSLVPGEERAYLYVQESKESTSKRFFFVTKKIEYTALTDLKKQNRFLKKTRYRTVPNQFIFFSWNRAKR